MNDGLLLRLISAGVNKIGRQTILTWALLLVVLASLVYGLTNIVRQLDVNLLWYISLLGLFSGWLLARTRLTDRQTVWIALLLGILFITWRVGNLGDELVQLIQVSNALANHTLRLRPDLPLPDLSPLAMVILELWSSFTTLLVRVFEWVTGIVGGRSAFDPIASALVWSLALWIATFIAGWTIRRHDRPLLALIPTGALLVSSLAFVRGSTSLIIPLLAATLFLMAKIDFAARERYWQKQAIDYAEDIRFDFALSAVLVVLTLTVLAMISPSISVRKFIDYVNRITENRPRYVQQVSAPRQGGQQSPADKSDSGSIGKSLGLEVRPTPTPEDILSRRRLGGLPAEHLLGSGPELSQEVVMVIRTVDLPSASQGLEVNQRVPRYYWRALTYDRYTGRGWATSPTTTIRYEGEELAQNEVLPDQRLLRQEVEFTRRGYQEGLLFAAGELVWVNQEYQIDWRSPPGALSPEDDPSNSTPIPDIFGALVRADTYTAESLLPSPNTDQLREAGSDYPDWIREHYLAIPQSVPPRVLKLAQDLTATEPTPYDRALAIEAYLRQYPYNLDLPVPPSDRDMADYFLFELKQGYCDYYATTMVVLSRAAGMPARLATGFASGRYDVANARYVVSEADAHSWPEIYFPGLGWIGFEPTAGRPALDRPAEVASIEVPELDNRNNNLEEVSPLNWLQLLSWAASLVGLSILAVFAWLLLDIWWLNRLSPATAIRRLYARLHHQAQGLDIKLEAGATPYELSAFLAHRLTGPGESPLRSRYLVPAANEAHQLTRYYARTIYSQHVPDAADRQNAIQSWRRLRRRLWLARFLKIPELRFPKIPTPR